MTDDEKKKREIGWAAEIRTTTEIGWKSKIVGQSGNINPTNSANSSATDSLFKFNRRSSTSSNSNSTSSSSASESSLSDDGKRQQRKRKKLEKREKRKEKKKIKKEKKLKRKEMKKERKILKKTHKKSKKSNNEQDFSIPLDLMTATNSMKPETPEEYATRQKKIRREIDPQTGRSRLVKGDGEILEEIVSRERHLEINRQANKGDSEYFQLNTTGYGKN